MTNKKNEIVDVWRDLSDNKNHLVIWKELEDYDVQTMEEVK